MKRRTDPTAMVTADVPSELFSFDPEDWPVAQEGRDWEDMVSFAGPVRAREILAHGAWSDARRAEADRRGIQLRDLPRARSEVVPH